jgi:prepilin-type N-terminal cleavage/methylation domain-containing protein
MKRYSVKQQQLRSRSAFSLVELLVVIMIIAILIALIVPALNGVRRRAQVAEVTAEINKIDAAITQFKSDFGVEPPSNLVIPAVGDPWDAQSRSKVRSIWPQFNFATNGGFGNPAALHMNGAECLTFFLGGVPQVTPTSRTVIGFSKNPALPWTAAGTNRMGPFLEFEGSRLIDLDGDGLLEYVDPIPDQRAPILYLASQGKHYNRVNDAAQADDFDVHGTPTNPLDMSSVYFDAANRPKNPNGYQLISPGFDGTYGAGGVYLNGDELTGVRTVEADNITNFANGQLKAQ